MTATWFRMLMDATGPHFKELPPLPSRSLSEKIAHTLWAIERIEQRHLRRSEMAKLREQHDSLAL